MPEETTRLETPYLSGGEGPYPRRVRMELVVVRTEEGSQWDHTGTRQSTLFVVRDTATGDEYLFDSFADWTVGSKRMVSVVLLDSCWQGLRFIEKPRLVKTLTPPKLRDRLSRKPKRPGKGGRR